MLLAIKSPDKMAIGALQVANIITMAVQNAHNYLHYLYTGTEFNVSYLSMKSDRPKCHSENLETPSVDLDLHLSSL